MNITDSMRVIAVANRKGGTGKTTTAVNLAAEWGRMGLRTLLIDFDTQGHCALGFGLHYRKGQPNIHQIFRQSELTLEELMLEVSVENVCLIQADTEFVLQQQALDIHLLRRLLKRTESTEQFQRVIIDTPPTLDALLLSAMVAAHGVLVPVVPHFLAEVGVRQLAKLFYQVATRYNDELRWLGLLPVMLDERLNMHRKVMKNLAVQFGKQRILRGIRSNVRLAEAFAEGKPVADFEAHCAGTMDYHLLAGELNVLWT